MRQQPRPIAARSGVPPVSSIRSRAPPGFSNPLYGLGDVREANEEANEDTQNFERARKSGQQRSDCTIIEGEKSRNRRRNRLDGNDTGESYARVFHRQQQPQFLAVRMPRHLPNRRRLTGRAFAKDNGGAIPSNLLQYPNTESNSPHIRLCKAHGIEPHPARFPKALPEFFIKLLTQTGDLVLDPFAGSNTTGEAAESLGRRWLVLECNRDYLIGSAFRFMADWPEDDVAAFVAAARNGDDLPLLVLSAQKALF